MLFILPFAALMALIFLAPMAFVFITSVISEDTGAFTFEFFQRAFTMPLYRDVMFRTVEIAAMTTLITVVLAYPVAYYLARQSPTRRIYLSMLLLLPFYTSILVKSFALGVLLGHHGVVNEAIRAVLGDWAVLQFLYNRTGVYLGIVHDMLPFVVFPLLVSILSQSPALYRAAEIMGASRTRIFWQITVPLSIPGLMAGVLLVMVRVMGQYAVPSLLGGRQDLMMANIVGFHINEALDWNMAAAVSVVLLLVAGLFLAGVSRIRGADVLSTKGV